MNEFELNVAVDGTHYCRIILPDTLSNDAQEKARTLRFLLSRYSYLGKRVEVTMTLWNRVGEKVEITD